MNKSNKNAILRMLAAALCLALCICAPAQAISLFGGSDEGIRESAIADDGVLRVYLKSLAAPAALTIDLNGVYTIENDAGFRFDRNARVVLSDGGGRIWLSAGGLTIDMGAALTLTRHFSDAGENGMRIAETGRETLYAGDLTVSLEEGGGLRAVLSINMEDYLCGVVAYEMSDSWPLEALKAQAVAARTYAMQRKWSAGSRDYDIVDTTADQVFKGYNAEYANVARAVQETAGVVGTYNGGFATCYYTASNGGEIALPGDVWSGGGDYGYLARAEDPYDLENPNSMVSSVSFAANARDLADLHTMLSDALAAAAQDAGISTEGLELEEILSIEPVEPVADGSKMYTKLRFTVTASTPAVLYRAGENDAGAPGEPTGSPAADMALYTIDYMRRLLLRSPYVLAQERIALEEPFAIDLSVYDHIKDGLDLGLNGSDYEMVSVLKDADGFTIEMRRFGHGVGMSQRGAQRMAGVHEKTWLQILNFYYPGMTLEKIAWATPELTPIEALPEGVGAARPDPTPKPTPAPLPALQAGEYYAAVALDDSGSTLNVRQAPGTHNPVVTHLTSGRRVIVCGEADADGWVLVKTAEESGYVKLEYLEKE